MAIDDAGRDLAAKLGPVAEKVRSDVDGMSKGLESVGQAVAEMGTALAATDRASTVKPK